MTVETAPVELSDALRTVAINGAYNASRALSKWVRHGVRLTSDGFQSVPIANAASVIGAPDEAIAAIHLPLEGDLTGDLLLAFPEKAALTLADMVMQSPPGTCKAFDELVESVLCETGNIVGSSYANSLAKWLRLRVAPSVPTFAHDMVSAIVAPLLAETALHHDHVLVSATEFTLDGERLQWSLLLLPSHASFATMEERCHLDSVRREALHTIAVNGAFNASRAMSKWLKKGVKIWTDGFDQVLLGQATEVFDREQPIVALLMSLSDQLHGHTLLAMTEANALTLVDLLKDQPVGTSKTIGDIERSCLEETGNIISGAFVNSWSTWLDLEIKPTVPQFVMDMPDAVMDGVMADQAMLSDELFVARTDFVLDTHELEWMFLLLPSPSALHLIEKSCE